MISLEDLVLVHRYLYYVLGQAVISDAVYDALERQARAEYPQDSVVHKVGSSNPKDYPEHVVLIAKAKLNEAN